MVAMKNKYPPEAFAFVQRGLDFTVRQLHGEPAVPAGPSPAGAGTPGAANITGPAKPAAKKPAPPPSPAAAPASGAPGAPGEQGEDDNEEPISRHVTGPQLCQGLRDFAIDQYGLLAQTVLRRWRVTSCEDFGHIVFAMVEAGMMRKTDDDRIEDFRGVYDFNEVFSPEMSLLDKGRQ